jgi:hypothetical protein
VKSPHPSDRPSFDWNTHEWTVPFNAGVAKLFNVGDRPVQLQLGGIYNLTAPDGVPRWGLQTMLTFPFPKAR